MAKYTHIQQRAGAFYFRIAVPTHLTAKMGCRELTCSLRTKSVHDARIKCYYLTTIAHYVFKIAEEMEELTTDQLREISRKYFKECLDRFDSYKKAHLTNRMALPSSSYEAHPDGLSLQKAVAQVVAPFAKQESIDNEAYLFQMVDHSIEKQFSPALDPNSYAYKQLTVQGMERVRNEFKNLIKQHANFVSEFKVKDEWFGDLVEDYVPVTQPTVTSPRTTQAPASGHKFSDVVKEYVEANKDSIASKTLSTKERVFALWIEICGDKDISNYTKRDDGRKFVKKIKQLPKNASTRFKGKTVDELIAMELADKLAPKTINGYLIEVGSLFNWASGQDLFEGSSPVQGLALRETSLARNQRDPFSKQQLNKIFTSTIYKGCKSEGRRSTSGDNIYKDSIYWVPLIGLYSGMRLNEICQLGINDVRKEDGVWVFDNNLTGDNKKLKNSQSKRLVPVHTKLIELGFINHVQTVQAAGARRLFTDIELASDETFSSSFSKKFGRLLKAFGIRDLEPKNATFHSFRHNFSDALRNSDVKDSVHKELMGHEDSSTTARYGSATKVNTLKQAIDKVTYNINWGNE